MAPRKERIWVSLLVGGREEWIWGEKREETYDGAVADLQGLEDVEEGFGRVRGHHEAVACD